MDELAALKESFQSELASVQTLSDLQQLRNKYSGKKGVLTAQLKSLSSVSPEQRPAFGKTLNEIKEFVESELKSREIVEKGGAQIVEVDKKSFSDAMKPVYDKFIVDPKMKDMIKRVQDTK